jgi:hypothetical protein
VLDSLYACLKQDFAIRLIFRSNPSAHSISSSFLVEILLLCAASMSAEFTNDATFTLELRKLPYDKRWNVLKPKLETLFYTAEVEQISRILKQRWGFDAT